MKKKFNSKNVFNACLIFFSLGIIIFSCVYDNNLIKLISTLPALNPFWLFFAFLSIFIVWLIDAKVIKTITESVYPDRYNMKKAFKVTMVGQFFSSVTPLGIAGQPMQLIALTQQGISSGIAASILVRKFLVHQTTITFYSLIVIIGEYTFFSKAISGFMSLAIIGFASQAFVVLLLILLSINKSFTTKILMLCFKLISKTRLIKNPDELRKKLEKQLNYYIDNNKSMNQDIKLTLKLYATTFLQLTILFSVPFLIYKAYHYADFPFIDMISAQALLTMMASYTPLPGGSGTNEGGFILIFNIFFDSTDITQVMLLWRFITYYSCIIFGLFFAKLGNKEKALSLDLP